MTRRFDIGPFILVVASLVLLVSLFLTWVNGNTVVGRLNAWELFEITDLLLAVLAIAAVVAAAGLILPDIDYVDRHYIPWIVGAAFLLVVNHMLGPSVGPRQLGTGVWVAFGATIAMIAGAVLSLTKVSVAVAVEGRDRRQRVSTVDHRPPTESGAPVSRSSSSLLHPEEPKDAGGQ